MAKELSASKKMEEVYDLSVKEMVKALKGEKNVTDLTKMAVTSMGVYAKLESIELHRDVFKFQVIRDISKDKKELTQYINSSMPEVKPVKRLR